MNNAIVAGVPGERFGSRVAAVIQPYADPLAAEGAGRALSRPAVGYKVPRTYAFVAEIQRSPAGKADYRWARRVAERAAAAR